MLFTLFVSLTLVRGQTDSRIEAGQTLDCFDTTPSCVKLGQLGYCETNDLVKERCHFTCDTCPTPDPTAAPTADPDGTVAPSPTEPGLCSPDPQYPDCCDTVDTCEGFKAAGACERGSQAIKSICQNTCGFCDLEPQCAASTFDCYAVQMACATQLRQSGTKITPEALIECVLPEANRMGGDNPEDCCYKWTLYQNHCAQPEYSDNCECRSYEAYHSGECAPCTEGVDCPERSFTLRHSIFQTHDACVKSSSLGARKLVNAYTYQWRLNQCNVKYPAGSVYVTCGASPGTLNEVYYKREDCKGTMSKKEDIPPNTCEKYQKKYSSKYVYVAPETCGMSPTFPPTPPPISITLPSYKAWKKYCKKKSNSMDCESCGGKWKSGKGRCKVAKEAATKKKCTNMGADVCEALGCSLDTAGRQPRCRGETVNPGWN